MDAASSGHSKRAVATLTPAHIELEIKLVGPWESLKRAMHCAEFRRHSLGRVSTQDLQSIYYDTPDEHLRGQGIGLRVRRTGRQWVQTVKRERDTLAGAQERDEFECSVTDQTPDLAPLAHGGFADMFSQQDLRERLGIVFRTTFRRTTRLLGVGHDARIEIALDHGYVEGRDREQVCEMELELKAGERDALYKLSSWLCAKYALRIEPRSKASRGYALARGVPQEPERADRLDLDAHATPARALAIVASHCVRHILANEDGTLRLSDPEYLHQLRVGIRRLRSALSLFKTALPAGQRDLHRARMRALANSLGAARDWDVFCTQWLPGLGESMVGKAGFTDIVAAASGFRNLHREQALRSYRGLSMAVAILDLEAAIQAPAAGPSARADSTDSLTSFARTALASRWRVVLKRLKRLDRRRPETLHALRIELKKVRYGCEFFGALFPEARVRVFFKLLQKLQQSIGALCDDQIALRQLHALRDFFGESPGGELLKELIDRSAAGMPATLSAIIEQCKTLKTTDPFWADHGKIRHDSTSTHI